MRNADAQLKLEHRIREAAWIPATSEHPAYNDRPVAEKELQELLESQDN